MKRTLAWISIPSLASSETANLVVAVAYSLKSINHAVRDVPQLRVRSTYRR